MAATEHMLHKINEKLLSGRRQNAKKWILYGLSEYTKKALAVLAQNNIYISGFLLEDSQSGLSGMKFLKKPLFTMQSIREVENEIVILDIFGDNISQLEKTLTCPIYTVFHLTMNSRKVILYGAGVRG